MKRYTKNLNVMITPTEYEQLAAIKKKHKISLSKLMRQNIAFLIAFYTK
jgi:hypothetical protein